MKRCNKKGCGSYAFNLQRDGIEQGCLCDVHYWQAKAEANAETARQKSKIEALESQVSTGTADDCISMREQIDEDNMEIAKLRLECTRNLTALHFWQDREENARHDALEDAANKFDGTTAYNFTASDGYANSYDIACELRYMAQEAKMESTER